MEAIVRRIVVVVGSTAAGKSTVGHYLESHHEFEVINGSDMLRRAIPGLRDMDDASARSAVDEFILLEGADVVVREAVLPRMLTDDGGQIAYTGLRSCGGLLKLVESAALLNWQLILVEVRTSTSIRYARAVSRGRIGGDLTGTAPDQNLKGLFSDVFFAAVPILAQVTIENSGTRTELIREVERVVIEQPPAPWPGDSSRLEGVIPLQQRLRAELRDDLFVLEELDALDLLIEDVIAH